MVNLETGIQPRFALQPHDKLLYKQSVSRQPCETEVPLPLT